MTVAETVSPSAATVLLTPMDTTGRLTSATVMSNVRVTVAAGEAESVTR